MDVSLEPLDEFLVIQPTADETETRAGLILPASAAQAAPCRTGIVTAIGTDVTGVEPGDKVLYPRDAGFEVRLGGIEVKVVKRERADRPHSRLTRAGRVISTSGGATEWPKVGPLGWLSSCSPEKWPSG